MQLGISVGAL